MLLNPFALSAESVCDQLGVDARKGLSDAQVRKIRAQKGLNQMTREKPKPVWKILLAQFMDPVIYVLGAAIVLALSFGEFMEAYAIFIVILITVSIGFVMEFKAIRSLESLRKMSQVLSKVLRNGRVVVVSAEQIVPGDILLLGEGDLVTADARLVSNDNLKIDESVITGESFEVEKITSLLPADTILPDQSNMVFKGSIVRGGYGNAVVTSTGADTIIGQIQGSVSMHREKRTPLEKKLSRLSGILIWIALLLVSVIAILGILQGRDLVLMIETGIALAIASIPEGLPIVATIALARGMLRLTKMNVLIKKLEVVQSLGEMGVLCTDKTGTLTENDMKVEQVVWQHGDWNTKIQLTAPLEDPILNRIIEIGILCSNVRLENGEAHGDAQELALLRFAIGAGADPHKIKSNYTESLEIPFDPESRMMTTVHQTSTGKLVCVKGAYEKVAEKCIGVLSAKGILPIKKDQWSLLVSKLASDGMRVLAMAYKECPRHQQGSDPDKGLILAGLVGFIDPARQDVPDVVKTYHSAGIRVVMVTGDHPETASAIADQIGLFEGVEGSKIPVHGKDIDHLLQDEASPRLLDTIVFARVSPSQKLDLVKFYQHHKHVVGMTGDGINDIPALKMADVGIAMGIRGTEAAREAADVVLQDDRFSSIEMAIRQGRIIFENIRMFAVYLLSSNLAEIMAVALSFFLHLPSPLLPMQILFLNLVTDVFPALALGVGKGEKDIMKQLPRKSDEPIMTARLWKMTALYGLTMTMAVLGISYFALLVLRLDAEKVNNLGFYTLVYVQLLNVFNVTLRKGSIFKNQVTQNYWIWAALLLCVVIMISAYSIPMLQKVLSLVPLQWNEFKWVLIFGLLSLMLTQLFKWMVFTSSRH